MHEPLSSVAPFFFRISFEYVELKLLFPADIEPDVPAITEVNLAAVT